MKECMVTSGCLIEMTFARMCRGFPGEHRRHYADLLNRSMQYRGLQREPLLGWMEAWRGSGVVEPTDQELEACLFLDELEDAGRAQCDIILALEDAKELIRRIQPPVEREIIWTRCLDVDNPDAPPPGTVLLGYEPDEFYPPICYSPIANCLFFTVFPERKPCPEEGRQFRTHYDKLNRWGLFDTRADAEEYLRACYSLFPDEQRYACYMMEVRAVAD